MVSAHEVGSVDPRTSVPTGGPTSSVQLADLSEDARGLLRMISHRTSLHSRFTAGDVLGTQPRHSAPPGGPAALPMDEAEVTLALQELSQHRGWLASFRPGRYVFRALAHDGRVEDVGPAAGHRP
jgi:hypothetical protein